MIKIGDRVRVKGDTQDYILVDPSKTYSGAVIGRKEGQLFVRLDEPVTRGVNKFEEVSVPEHRASNTELPHHLSQLANMWPETTANISEP